METDWKVKIQKYIKPEYFFWTAVACALFFVLDIPKTATKDAVAAATVATIGVPAEDPYAKLEILAKAVYIYDFREKRQLFARNEFAVLPLASITKIMTAITALSLIPETTFITITERSIREEGDSGLNVGEKWLLRDLLKFLLVESSNDGAVAVSSAVGAISATVPVTEEEGRVMFIKEMNRVAQSIGLKFTSFKNESGLDIDGKISGAESTAEETAHLLAYALFRFPSVFEETRFSELAVLSEDGKVHSAENTNKDIGDFPLLIASKTGYTDLAGGNLVIAFDAGFNHPIIISILGSTVNGRFSDAEKLVWATLKYLAQAR